jgi:transposase, IS5 family
VKQQTLAMAADQNSGFEQFHKPTRRDDVLATTNTIVPWSTMCSPCASEISKANVAGGSVPQVQAEEKQSAARR